MLRRCVGTTTPVAESNRVRSPMRTAPSCGSINPSTARKSEVLPLPAGPTSATAVLGGTASVTPLRISRSLARSRTCSTTSSAMPLPTITDWDADTTLVLLASMGQLLVQLGLARKSTRVEKCLLLARAGATERRIAMREAAEALNDIGVQLRPAGEVGIAQRRDQGDGARLIGLALRMLKWKIEKQLLRRRYRPIEPTRNRAIRHATRLGIGGEGTRVAAEHVARELIEQDDERQRVLWCVLPGRQR